ncbi:MAG TPA: hypothetical protein VG317_04065 [Pseudonocardiaceae bacterium]|nr:hypothetical protein [Pseudonocardiaceae bacterium]
MIELTTEERLIWRQLRDRARAGSVDDPQAACIYYGDLGRLVDPAGTWHFPRSRPQMFGFNIALGHVSEYEHQHGRPLLSSLVVAKSENQPGKGFAPLAASLGYDVTDAEQFWRDEIKKTVAFWSSTDDTLLRDAAVDRVLGELEALKKLLGGL